MALDQLPDLDPDPEEVLDGEVAITDDVLVKVFALGPGGAIDAHSHEGSTSVFHVVEGTVTVVQDDTEEAVDAPGVVVHDPGVSHGARNESEDQAVLTTTFAPPPG